jgi:hypothetical protein
MYGYQNLGCTQACNKKNNSKNTNLLGEDGEKIELLLAGLEQPVLGYIN